MPYADIPLVFVRLNFIRKILEDVDKMEPTHDLKEALHQIELIRIDCEKVQTKVFVTL